jgi:sortase (surface protein transpeptidase)
MVTRRVAASLHGGGHRGLAYVLALVAAAGGVVAIVIAIRSQQSAPQPDPSSAGTISPFTTSATTDGTRPPARVRATGSASTASVTPRSVPASAPVSIDIAAIGVHSGVIAIGKAPDGTLAVPQPGPDLNKAAWYEDSVTPGQAGPSVIEGHVDSTNGPSVFYSLGAVKPGNSVRVTRKDGSVAIFTVNAVRSYPSHAAFPTAVVYGADLAHPTLRLITCSNFDNSTGHYVGNTVVFAHLAELRHLPAG